MVIKNNMSKSKNNKKKIIWCHSAKLFCNRIVDFSPERHIRFWQYRAKDELFTAIYI